MALIFYYLTEDSDNLKESNEIKYLRSIGRVVVVTRGSSSPVWLNGDIKHLNLPAQSHVVVAAYFLWTKLCYLFCRTSNSRHDKEFPARNLYTGNALVRWLINRLWPLKYIGFINKQLPTYESLYFFPFRIVRLFVRDKRRSDSLHQRVFVHDALILRLTRFTSFILMARRNGFRTVANVKSWDNPFYTQFAQGADGYLTWSQRMWNDVQRFHRIGTSAHHTWGPRPFYNFARAVHCSEHKPNIAPGTMMIGYAAAFCDTLMAAQEVKVMADIAEHLLENGVDAKILFRPYPIMPMSSYEPLLHYSNIEIVDIKGPPSDRFGDGREMIRFGSDQERIQYLSRCHCFLSICTSFTFEAALFGLPVIQYFVPKSARFTEHESMFFERLDNSDHVLTYFLPYLPVAKNAPELVGLIKAFEIDSVLRRPPKKMLRIMGFPSEQSAWDESAANLISDMQLEIKL